MKCFVLLFAVTFGACDTIATLEKGAGKCTKGQEERVVQLYRELGECRGQLFFCESAQGGATSTVAPSFPVWKTLQLGTDQPTDPAGELKRRGFKVSEWAKELLAKTSFVTEPTAVDLVRVTVSELGLKDGATTKEIFDRAAALGLTRLPAEAGYRLRLALTDQPMDEWILVGMDPIADSDGDPSVWNVRHGGDDRWLNTLCVGPASQWDPVHVWVFGRSKH